MKINTVQFNSYNLGSISLPTKIALDDRLRSTDIGVLVKLIAMKYTTKPDYSFLSSSKSELSNLKKYGYISLEDGKLIILPVTLENQEERIIVEKPKETIIETKQEYLDIISYWNSKKIIINKPLPSLLRDVKNILKELSIEEVKKAIDVYAEVLHSKDTIINYSWSLGEFLRQKNGARVYVYKTINDYKIIDKNKPKQIEINYSSGAEYL